MYKTRSRHEGFTGIFQVKIRTQLYLMYPLKYMYIIRQVSNKPYNNVWICNKFLVKGGDQNILKGKKHPLRRLQWIPIELLFDWNQTLERTEEKAPLFMAAVHTAMQKPTRRKIGWKPKAYFNFYKIWTVFSLGELGANIRVKFWKSLVTCTRSKCILMWPDLKKSVTCRNFYIWS